MATLCLQEEEIIPEKLEGFSVLHDKGGRGFKEKDYVQNAWQKVAENLDFTEKW